MRGSIAASRDETGRKLNISAGGAVVSMAEGALNLSRGRGEGLEVTGVARLEQALAAAL